MYTGFWPCRKEEAKINDLNDAGEEIIGQAQFPLKKQTEVIFEANASDKTG